MDAWVSQMGVINGEKMNLQEEDPTNTIFERIEPASSVGDIENTIGPIN